MADPALNPMMSGLASGLRARVWNTAPASPSGRADRERGEHPRYPQPHDHDGGTFVALSREGGCHLPQRRVERARRKSDDRGDRGHDQRRDEDQGVPATPP